MQPAPFRKKDSAIIPRVRRALSSSSTRHREFGARRAAVPQNRPPPSHRPSQSRRPPTARRTPGSPTPKRHLTRVVNGSWVSQLAVHPPQPVYPLIPLLCAPPFCDPRRECSLVAPNLPCELLESVLPGSCPKEFSKRETVPRRKPRSVARSSVFPALSKTRIGRVDLRARACKSAASIRCEARPGWQMSKAESPLDTRPRPHQSTPDLAAFRSASRAMIQSYSAIID